MVYTPAPIVYHTPASIAYHTPQKLKPFTNFVNLTPYKPSTEEETEDDPEEDTEEEREGKLVVEEERSVEDTVRQGIAAEGQSKIEEPSKEVVFDEVVIVADIESSPEEESKDPLGPPEKGRTGTEISMRPFVDLGGEVEIVEEEEDTLSLPESEKLVIEPILITITSTEPTIKSTISTTTTTTPRTTTTISTTSEESSSKKEETSSVHPLPFPFPTTTTASDRSTPTTPTPTTTTTASERMEALLEMAMERLKEMEKTLESS